MIVSMLRSPFVAALLLVACDRTQHPSADLVASATPARALVDDKSIGACQLSYNCGLSHPGLGSSSRTTSIDFATCVATRSSQSGPFEPTPGPFGPSDASTHTSSSSNIAPAECTRLQKLTTAITDEDAKREQEPALVDTEACTLTLTCPPDARPKISVQRQSLTGGGAVVTLINALQSAPASASTPAIASAAASASASAISPSPRIPCGTTTCAPSQYCVRYSRGQGIAPPPGQPAHQSTSFECWDSLPAQGGGMACAAPSKDRQVSCQALIPARPPHP
jgi:hypothetical protein